MTPAAFGRIEKSLRERRAQLVPQVARPDDEDVADILESCDIYAMPRQREVMRKYLTITMVPLTIAGPQLTERRKTPAHHHPPRIGRKAARYLPSSPQSLCQTSSPSPRLNAENSSTQSPASQANVHNDIP